MSLYPSTHHLPLSARLLAAAGALLAAAAVALSAYAAHAAQGEDVQRASGRLDEGRIEAARRKMESCRRRQDVSR